MKTALKPSAPVRAVAHDPYAALRFKNYRLFAVGSIFATIGDQMRHLAVGWELYERTSSAMVLGLAGLAVFLPVFFFTLPAGQAADRFSRRKILIASQLLQLAAALGLAALSYSHGPLSLIFLCLAALGLARAFNSPASASLLPSLLPRSAFANAVTWLSSGFQISAMLGPLLGSILIAFRHSATAVYLVDALANLVFIAFLFALKPAAAPVKAKTRSTGAVKDLLAGLSFVWKDKIILSSLTLDLFAVLLGGVTALMPIFAKDILHSGPLGLGALRAAPLAGALCMALTLAHRPPMKKAGPALLWAVAGFGACTFGFAVSKVLWFSLLMLFLTGAFDNISVVVRHTLVQLRTPDAMRGRVSAVNNVFISSSNELGEFESGAVAQWLGPVTSAAAGGVGTLLVVLSVTLFWPQIRRLKDLR